MLTSGAAGFTSVPGRRAWLLRISWLSGIAAMAFAASFFAPDRWGAIRDAALSIAASVPLLVPRSPGRLSAELAPPIARHAAALGLGAISLIAFALTMGRGMAF